MNNKTSLLILFLLGMFSCVVTYAQNNPCENGEKIVSEASAILEKLDKTEFKYQDELYESGEFEELREVCPRNWRIILSNWDKLTKGKKSMEAILYDSFKFRPSCTSAYKINMSPTENLMFMEEAFSFFKKRNAKEMYFTLISSGAILHYNYTNAQARNIIQDVIATGLEWKQYDRVKSLKQCLDGSSFFNTLSHYHIPPPNGDKRMPLKVYAIGQDYTDRFIYTLSAYSQGKRIVDEDTAYHNGKAPMPNKSKASFNIEDIHAYYGNVPTQIGGGGSTDTLKSGSKSYIDDESDTTSMLWAFSPIAENELLKWLKEKKLSLEKRLMIVNVLWRGMYATDQVERFLPMLKADEKEIREMAFSTMPDWLKEGIKYDASKMPTEKEYAAISAAVQENIKKNPDKLIVFEQEK